jgi:hypothetical protein
VTHQPFAEVSVHLVIGNKLNDFRLKSSISVAVMFHRFFEKPITAVTRIWTADENVIYSIKDLRMKVRIGLLVGKWSGG